MTRLSDLQVLVVDCQASGATPAYGDLLELAWAVCGANGIVGSVQSHFIVPRTHRRVPGPVREITGWSEARLAESVPEEQAFRALHQDVSALAASGSLERVPTVIHVARFELPFLRDLYARLAHAELPLDVACVHAAALRLFPDLPRRNIRALAGFLGHSVSLTRCALGHVEATAFIWRTLLPRLEEQGVGTWQELAAFLAEPSKAARGKRRTFPLPVERRRTLPSGPGVYRFVRKNGDVLYVGKATSLKKRIAGHFRSTGPHTERALELLSQVHDIVVTETPSTLEAALLESDEIKAIDPPYNVQLRMHERSAWFATRRFDDARAQADDVYAVGPLPSRGAVSALHALEALSTGREPTAGLCAMALAVPKSVLPDPALFADGLRDFLTELERASSGAPVTKRVARAALTLWLERRRNEVDESKDDLPPDGWDLARVRRRLDRNLIQAGLLVRRARWLCLLSQADLTFREAGMKTARALVVSEGELVAREEVASVAHIASLPVRRMSSEARRLRSFDAARYDRLRVLATELARVQAEGGELALRFGAHTFSGEQLAILMRIV